MVPCAQYTSCKASFSQAFRKLFEGDDDDDDSDVVGWSKDDDVMFQNSLLLLEEKMELLADLQQKAEKCRWLLFVFYYCDSEKLFLNL